MSIFLDYLGQLNSWSKSGANLGCRSACFIAAYIVGLPIGVFLLPFKSRRDWFLSNYTDGDGSTMNHYTLKKENAFYRRLNGFIKTLERINQELLMRPVGTIAGIVGGMLGVIAGPLLGIVIVGGIIEIEALATKVRDATHGMTRALASIILGFVSATPHQTDTDTETSLPATAKPLIFDKTRSETTHLRERNLEDSTVNPSNVFSSRQRNTVS